MFAALDANGDGTISQPEIIRFKEKLTKPKKEGQEANEDDDDDDEDSDESEETFVTTLDEKTDGEKDKLDEFEERFGLDEEKKETMEPFFKGLEALQWY